MDSNGYDEALDPEAREKFFHDLKPGDHFIYNYNYTGPPDYLAGKHSGPEEYVVVGIINNNISLRAASIESGRPGIFWHSDPKVIPVEIPEHEELHTDVGGYDEGLVYRRLAEEEAACRLTEGYDPSLDLGPLAEELQYPEPAPNGMKNAFQW